LRMNGWITIHLTCTCLQILALTRFANPKVLIAPHNRSLNRFYRIVVHQASWACQIVYFINFSIKGSVISWRTNSNEDYPSSVKYFFITCKIIIKKSHPMSFVD
jgi:hypothetical protein